MVILKAYRFRLREAAASTRVAVFVSRYDLCLLDLLWRTRRGELPMTVVQVIFNHPDLAADVASFGVPFEHVTVTRVTKPARRDYSHGSPIRNGEEISTYPLGHDHTIAM